MRSFDFFPLIDDSASTPKAYITENGRKNVKASLFGMIIVLFKDDPMVFMVFFVYIR